MHRRTFFRSFLSSTSLTVFVLVGASSVCAQEQVRGPRFEVRPVSNVRPVADKMFEEVVTASAHILSDDLKPALPSMVAAAEARVGFVQSFGSLGEVQSVTGGGSPRRRALLIGGLALSMAAYGYFILEFNNSRAASARAEAAYEEDVRLNAQTYVDQGIELYEIQSFTDWQAAYDDAKSSREWAARAGFLAIVIGFFAILDAATTYDQPPPEASSISIRPTVDLTPLQNDVMVGARVKF